MKLISNDTRRQFFRFYELYDRYKKNGETIYLKFEDRGYVEDIDLFLTGCFSRLPLSFTLDGKVLEWELLSDVKKFKTMLDFRDDKITCQGKLYSEIQGMERNWFMNMEITTYIINPGPTDFEELKKFLQL